MADKPRILIIEDDPPLLMMMVYLLTRAGCDTLVAWSGNKGIQLAEKERIDLITLDIDLPDMDGFEICRRLKQSAATCHLPVIFVSGRIFEEDRQRAFELGAADYLEKPFPPSVFIEKIFSHIKASTARA